MFNSDSIDIYSDRDKIREQFIDYLQFYLGVESIDIEKTSYLAYIINMLSSLSANLFFYASSAYRESFMTRALSKEAVLDLSTMLGYRAILAIPASAQLYITIPLEFSDQSTLVNIRYPQFHKFYANTTVFELDSEILITITGLQTINPVIKIIAHSSAGTIILPFILAEDLSSFSFNANVTQQQSVTQEYSIPNLQPYEFFTQKVINTNTIVENSLSIYTYTDSNLSNPTHWGNPSENYIAYDSLFLIDSDVSGYAYRVNAEGLNVYFGNGIIGLQPNSGDVLTIEFAVTEGATGNVSSGTITTAEALYLDVTIDGQVQNLPLQMVVTNPSAAYGGTDASTIDQIRNAALNNVTANDRLVSARDYQNIKNIIPSLPINTSIEVLKRSDLKRNEITLFTDLYFDNYLVPTKNLSIQVYLKNLVIKDYTIYAGEVLPSTSDYVALFDMVFDVQTNLCTYQYTLDKVTSGVTAIDSASYSFNPISAKFQTIKNQVSPSDSTVDIYAYYNTITTIPKLSSYTATVACLDTSFELDLEIDAANNYFLGTALLVNIPQGEQTYQFTVYDGPKLINGKTNKNRKIVSVFLANILVKQDLSKMMQSEINLSLPTLTTIDTTTKLTRNIMTNYDLIPHINVVEITKVWATEGAITITYQPGTDYQQLGDYIEWIGGIVPIDDYSMEYTYATPSLTASDSFIDVYNVPTLLKTYWNNLGDQRDAFVLQVLSKIVQFDVSNYRMLTDFVNLKFANTTGILDNMQYTPILSYLYVEDVDTAPTDMIIGKSYLITNRNNPWSSIQAKSNFIVTCRSGDLLTWGIINLRVNNMVSIHAYELITTVPASIMIYNGDSMQFLVQEIPLKVEILIKKDPKVTSSEQSIVTNVQNALLTNLSSKFGYDSNLSRSEIIDIVQEVSGVLYCELLNPKFDILFDYILPEGLTSDQILQYTPQLVYMDPSNTTITVTV